MSKITINRLDFSYDNPYKEIFNDLNLILDTEWKTVIFGKNGRGKTTFMKLLSGELVSSKGTISKECEINFFPKEIPDETKYVLEIVKNLIAPFKNLEDTIAKALKDFQGENIEIYSTAEELYSKYGGYTVENKIEKEMEMLNLDLKMLSRSWNTLSGGEKTKFQLLSLFLKNDSYPIIDEPTNHLDIEGREQIARYLNGKSGFLCVSHDRNFLDTISDHVLAMEKNKVYITKSSFLPYYQEMKNKEMSAIKKNEELKKEIRFLQESAKEKINWSFNSEKQKSSERNLSPMVDKGYVGAQAARIMKRAVSIKNRKEKEIEERKELLLDLSKEHSFKFLKEKNKADTILTVNNLNISYDEKTVIQNFNLTLKNGERICLKGPNGCGKSSIINAIKKKIPYTGIIFIPNNIRVVYLEQEFEATYLELTLKEYIRELGEDEAEFRKLLSAFGVYSDILNKKLKLFSEGEKKKINLASTMLRESSLLVWDEPLNYIDMEMREKLEEMILKYKPTILFIEHDKMFIENIATKVFYLYKN
ncbi:MAG: ribosomal protection-like ABC-F family protein [Cetobacterium sp.]